MPIVFITGSGRRIGKGLALEFAQRGWDVVVHYNQSGHSAFDTVSKIHSFGRKAVAVKANVLSYDEVAHAFEEAVNKIGIPNVLVNNAGIFPEKVPLDNLTREHWEHVLGINLRGELFASRIFARYARDNSRIINIASLGGLEVWDQRIAYNVSKAGVIHLTKALARELAPKISVNCVCPGSIYLPEEPSPNDPSMIPEKRIPMQRWGTVDDVFQAVYFFATATNYITSQIISVDGGYHNTR